MLSRTHLLITLFFVLIFLNGVENKFVFVLTAIVATYIPDIDSKTSKIGRKKEFRFFQFFIKHRGVLHSLNFFFLISIFIYIYFPFLFQGFFLGYLSHLFADSLTIQGIYLFYPIKKKIHFKIRTGKNLEDFLYVFFLVLDSILFIGHILVF